MVDRASDVRHYAAFKNGFETMLRSDLSGLTREQGGCKGEAPMGSHPFAKRSNSSNSQVNRRRSTRVDFETPVILSGRNVSGQTFREETATTTVSFHGAKIRTVAEVLVGMQVCVENPSTGQQEKAVCVRVDAEENSTRSIAVQLVRPGNIWGLENPPADWGVEQALNTAVQTAIAKSPDASKESGPSIPILESQAVPWEVQSAALTESILQNLRPQVQALMENALQEFEGKLKRVETETGSRLEARSEKVLSDITLMVESLRSELAKQLATQGAQAVDSAEQDLRTRVAQILSPLAGLANTGAPKTFLEPMAKK